MGSLLLQTVALLGFLHAIAGVPQGPRADLESLVRKVRESPPGPVILPPGMNNDKPGPPSPYRGQYPPGYYPDPLPPSFRPDEEEALPPGYLPDISGPAPPSRIRRESPPGPVITGEQTGPVITGEQTGPVITGEQTGQEKNFRCPFPPDENGEWPDYCVDVIDTNSCQCLYDDMILTQIQCLQNGRAEYEELLRTQMKLERQRDLKRMESGLGPRRVPYQRLWFCYSQVPEIMKQFEKK